VRIGGGRFLNQLRSPQSSSDSPLEQAGSNRQYRVRRPRFRERGLSALLAATEKGWHARRILPCSIACSFPTRAGGVGRVARAQMHRARSRGTEGSNPAPSSGESPANLRVFAGSGARRQRRWPRPKCRKDSPAAALRLPRRASPPHWPFHLGQAYRVRSRLAAGGNRIRTRGPMSGGEPARTNELSSHHNCGGRSELSPNLMRDERLQFLPQHRRDPG